MLRAGQVTQERTHAALRPWLSIALLCGAAITDLQLASETRGQLLDDLATLTFTPVDADEAERDYARLRARSLIADEVCQRSVWAPILTRARDAAMALIADGGASEDDQLSAHQLVVICRHLAHDINGRHSIAEYARPAAGERNAA